MQNKEKQLYVLISVLIITLLCILQVLLVHKGFYAISADEAGHTLEGYYWYKGTSSFFSIWLPFQKILYGLGFEIWQNLFWTPRIISSIFGVLTLISLMYLTFQLFKNKTISILSGFLGSVHWGIVIFSVLPMTEIYFSFFIIAALAFMVKWLREKKNNDLIALVIFSCIANTIRFESWVFSFLFFVVIIYDLISFQKITKVNLRNLVLYSSILFIFPTIWIILSFKVTGKIT